jgi:hypothetical protein
MTYRCCVRARDNHSADSGCRRTLGSRAPCCEVQRLTAANPDRQRAPQQYRRSPLYFTAVACESVPTGIRACTQRLFLAAWRRWARELEERHTRGKDRARRCRRQRGRRMSEAIVVTAEFRLAWTWRASARSRRHSTSTRRGRKSRASRFRPRAPRWWPKPARIRVEPQVSRRDRPSHMPCKPAPLPDQALVTENRGVPGSSPGLAIKKRPAKSRFSS